ncbi:uncharacterized protein ATNIH1004_004975 [Aspergillus tanneri]|uniref:ZW10 C-terminal helical domain-containing protein n=1 Tax=Aspergillus tanneri TaxID=1220188 RepID=A0A5M9MUR3_9EURO|nr:uncharacterized protein ATNIH1004_004975 [Aspergillus tanneri]KAA8649080.1 hypothetical protein ATNIH1004_004975 [Aspergillus tanneri]
MASKPSDQEISQSVLDFVTNGTYPESEKVIAAEFPVSALSKELDLLAKARAQVEAEISSLSRENYFDADGWISQAKQLHADIERSKVTAREIVAQHENTKPLQSKVEDAAAKVQLIETEIAFNQAVTNTLEVVQRLCQQLDDGRAILKEGQVIDAIDTLEAAECFIKKDSLFTNTTVLLLLSENISELRSEIAEYLRNRWNEQLSIDEKEAKLVVLKDNDQLEETITALTRLEILAPAKSKFQKDLVTAIIEPILLPGVDGYIREVHVEESTIQVDPQPSKASVPDALGHIASVLGFLRKRLPTSALDSFSKTFIPILSSKIIASLLLCAIPTGLEGLTEFESTLDHVLEFTNTIKTFGWHGQEELVSWVNQAPRLWLTRRRVDSLDQVRKVLAASQGSTKRVERVEKEKVSDTDEALLENATSDDWDASWDNDIGDEHQETRAETKDDEEDVSAWGLDDDTKDIAETPADASVSAEDDGADAWGWGDEDEEPPVADSQPKHSDVGNSVNSKGTAQHASPHEVTLREQYTVTDIPDAVLAIIRQQVIDSNSITHPAYVLPGNHLHTSMYSFYVRHSHSRVVSSGTGLLALPTLVLAMFKATATSFYGLKLNAGQMYLYNDSLYLADQVRGVADEYQLTKLRTDIEALERFGKLAYSKEMQTQRTIVTDLLDGTQGFSQCSEQPFLGECENAVSATVDRIRDVYNEWQPILSRSALLQSIGSLVSTVINKIVMEIEELGDISETQSGRLVSFCNQVSKLEDLFIPEMPENAERVPMTAVYVRNWLKFQYLINILESSLADIKFLWLEGELRLEFSPEEVIDLIEALFAESDHRRKTIAEIWRVSRNP